MLVQNFPSGPFSTNAYIIGCSITRKAAVIDPAPGSFQTVSNYLTQHHLHCDKIILTHSHWDHIADVAAIKQFTQAQVYIHPLDVSNLENPGADGLPCWIAIEKNKPDHLLQEGDEIKIGNYSFYVIHTPGHSPGSICLYCPQEHVLISGDTLFRGTIGNLSFPTCQPDLMWPSLTKLSKLPSQTKVYPGHGPQTTIGAESWLPRAKELFS